MALIGSPSVCVRVRVCVTTFKVNDHQPSSPLPPERTMLIYRIYLRLTSKEIGINVRLKDFSLPTNCEIQYNMVPLCRSKWPRGLRRRSAAARLLRSWVRIPPTAWMLVCCECCVLSGTGLCDELITRPEESYRLWCVVVCDLETSRKRKPQPTGGCRAKNKQTNKHSTFVHYETRLPTTIF